jgi:sigma-B regulation protein RsbU (phosphoserine phosphatase)
MSSKNKTEIAIIADSDEVKSIVEKCLPVYDIEPTYLSGSNDLISELESLDKIDALILDLDNRDTDFSVLLQKLHHDYPLLKVVVCSTDCQPGSVRSAMHYGVFDFIPKPLDYKDFDQSIQRALSAVQKLHRNMNDYDEIIAIEHELDVARNIQSSIIPKHNSVSHNPAYEITGRNQAAQKVGGDFFDYFKLDENRLGFVIGDVASKGIPAAIFMAVSRTLFKSIALQQKDPASVLKELNKVLVLESDPSMFIAILYGILDLNTGKIVYTNGGHTHPIIVRSKGSMQILDDTADIVLGVLEDAEYHLYHEKLNPGDIFFTATDGFNELTDLHGKPVSDHFLKRNLIKHRHQSPEQILNTIYESVDQIQPDSRSLQDDITCLIFKFKNCI